MCVWSLQKMLYVVPMHFNTTFRPSSHRGAHSVEMSSSLESFDRLSLLVAVMPLKSLIGAEYTKVFGCPHNQKSGELRSGNRAGLLTGPPRPIHCSPKVWLRCCLTMRRKWDGAPSCVNHMCCPWWRGTCSKSTGKSFTKRIWYTALVSLLLKTTGRQSWSPKMPT
jgi:hypothetical protein